MGNAAAAAADLTLHEIKMRELVTINFSSRCFKLYVFQFIMKQFHAAAATQNSQTSYNFFRVKLFQLSRRQNANIKWCTHVEQIYRSCNVERWLAQVILLSFERKKETFHRARWRRITPLNELGKPIRWNDKRKSS